MKIFVALVLNILLSFCVFAQMQAEVIVTISFLRKSPSLEGEKIQTLQKGQKVIVEDNQSNNDWYYVSMPNGKTKGWIRKEFLRSVTIAEKDVPKRQRVVQTSAPVVSEHQTSSPASASTANSESTTNSDVVEDEEVLRIETEEVNLNVRVVDNNNRPVNNLNQSDFKIYEDDVLQPITYLSTTEVPIINALVIDNSRSLRAQLKKIIEAGKIIVSTNRDKDESAVVRFVSTDKIEIIQDFTTKKNLLNNALDNLFVEGGQTAIIDAIYRTANKVEQYQNSEKKEDVKLRALVLVSDGEDRGSKYNEQQLFELLRNSHVQIYAIGFINDLSKEIDQSGASRHEKAKAFLTRLTQETGGKVYFPNSIDELPQIATEISNELRTQYLISYTPVNENNDATFRRIKVDINEGPNKEKRIAITRTGRNVQPKQ